MITSSSSWETTYLSFLTLIIPHEMACTWKNCDLQGISSHVKNQLCERLFASSFWDAFNSFWALSFKNRVSRDCHLTFEHYWQHVVWKLTPILVILLIIFFCSWIKKQADIGGIERNYEIALLMLKEGTHTLNVQQCCFKRYTCHFELL